MSEFIRSDVCRVDISKSLLRTYAGVVLATGDKNANRFGAILHRAGEAVDLTGQGVSVTGYFVRPDAETVVCVGAAVWDTVYVDLPEACYTQEGRFALAIKVSSTEVTQTVRVIDGYIRLTQTETLVDPGEVVPSLDELLAYIATMEAATEEAKEAADTANTAIENMTDMLADSAPGIAVDASGAMVSVDDAAARPAVKLVSSISSGRNAVTLTRTGKNILPISEYSGERKGVTFTSHSDGTYTLNGTAEADAFYRSRADAFSLGILPAGDYTMSVTPASAVWNVRARVIKKDGQVTVATTSRAEGIVTFAADGVTDYSAGFYVVGGATVSDVTVSIQIERGGSATAHEMYQGQAFTTDLSEAVYGGTLDWTSGILTVTHGADGAELTEPITHQLTPQQIALLKGSTNLWSDSGNTSVTYIADTKMYIDNKFTALQNAILAQGVNI